jgi:hypothetical protein
MRPMDSVNKKQPVCEVGKPCVISPNVGPLPICQVVIEYPKGSPDQPVYTASKDCPNPEVALAVILSALLRALMPD